MDNHGQAGGNYTGEIRHTPFVASIPEIGHRSEGAEMETRRPFRDLIHNELLGWVGRGTAGMATRAVLDAIRAGGYEIVPADRVRRTA